MRALSLPVTASLRNTPLCGEPEPGPTALLQRATFAILQYEDILSTSWAFGSTLSLL